MTVGGELWSNRTSLDISLPETPTCKVFSTVDCGGLAAQAYFWGVVVEGDSPAGHGPAVPMTPWKPLELRPWTVREEWDLTILPP